MAVNQRAWFIAAVLAVGLVFAPARADQEDARLNDLFEILLNASLNSIEAFQAQQAIWGVWLEAPTASGCVLMNQGVEQMQTGAYEAAIATFSALIELQPEFAEAWNKRATVYYLAGFYADSLADIDRTLTLEPRHFGAQSGQGMVYDALEEPEPALEAFEKALHLNPHMPRLRERIEQLKSVLQGREL